MRASSAHAERERGVSLLVTLLALSAMMAGGVSAVHFASSSARSAKLSSSSSSAGDIAEAGVNEALATLSNPGNNPLNADLLAVPVASSYPDGEVVWSGYLDESSSPMKWVISASAQVSNPTGPIDDLVANVVAHVPVTVTQETTPTETDAWDYVYSGGTGDPSGCDVTLDQGVEINAPLYAAGNLCLENSAKILAGPTHVQGQVWLKHPQSKIGSAASPISELRTAVGCKYRSDPLTTCSPTTNVWAASIGSTPPLVSPPTIDWDGAYLYASPGPYSRCTTISGTPPTFDNDQGTQANAGGRNRSVLSSFLLTPAGSYTCKTAGGELSWNSVTKTLTIEGMIFIDGDVKVDAGDAYNYDGRGSIYTSGSVLIKNSSLCAIVDSTGTTCDWTGWDPDTDDVLVFITQGAGGQTEVDPDATAELKSAEFQGALYGDLNVTAGTFSTHQGPLISNEALSGQSVTFYNFVGPSTLPVGTPGAPIDYATLGTPQIYR